MTIGVLFVCTGNICRSPTAVGVFRAMARRAAMDRSHLAVMRWMAPRSLLERPQMFLAFSDDARSPDVPDPFGGRARDYERALDLIEKGCAGLLSTLIPLVKTAT
jgi:protein-tyrosine phosphatase